MSSGCQHTAVAGRTGLQASLWAGEARRPGEATRLAGSQSVSPEPGFDVSLTSPRPQAAVSPSRRGQPGAGLHSPGVPPALPAPGLKEQATLSQSKLLGDRTRGRFGSVSHRQGRRRPETGLFGT